MNNKDLIQTLVNCAATCEMCADACLDEDNIKMMVNCIRLDRDCAKICYTTASLLASNSNNVQHLLESCAEICKMCGDECEKHKMDHCQECARACKECEEACRSYAQYS